MQPETAAVSAATAAVDAMTAIDATSAATQAVPATGFALVLEKIDYAIMVPLFYLALAFMIVALTARLVALIRAPREPFQLAIYPQARSSFAAAMRDAFGMPQIRKRDPIFWAFLAVFHVGLAGLVLGHFDILPTLDLVPPESRHMVGAGVVGVMVTFPVLFFMARRFAGDTRRISTPGDYLLLLLLLFTFLMGDLMSWGNSWTANGFVMTKSDFALYFDGLARFTFADPGLVLHGSHYHFAVLHVLLAELVFVVLPFSKVVHAFLAVPVNVLRRRVWTHS
ncbi:MAG: respiratory nitrate reductase subunit gamma [Spirochaetaceae bacterium]|nr:respiratory nitrate reductase subunit gamma [Spirochaetaceae bacterium]